MTRDQLSLTSPHPWRDRMVEAGLALAVAGLLFGVAAGPAFGAEPVVTAPRADVIATRRIAYQPQRLTDRLYVAGLKGEIRAAARAVCPRAEFNVGDYGASHDACVYGARTDAFAQLRDVMKRDWSLAQNGGATLVLTARR